jgi:hypothetical protein
MTIKAKTLVKDKFWIVEEHGQKLGTLQKKDDNGWIFLSKQDKKQIYHTQESLFSKFGINIFEPQQTEEVVNVNKWDRLEGEDYNSHGYPCSQKPYNSMFDVQKRLPIYTKTPKSKSVFCAGYYIVYFEKVKWRKAYCPKLITLQRYAYKGPIKSKVEMLQILNNAIKNQDTNKTD